MKHIFEDLEVPIAFKQDLEAFEGHQVTVQRIIEGQVIYFGQICHSSLIKNTQRVRPLRTGFRLLHFQVLGWD